MAFIGAHFDKRCLSCVRTYYAPVTACYVGHSRDVKFTSLAVLAPAIARFLQRVYGNLFVFSVLGLHDKLPFGDLLFHHIIGIDLIELSNHLACWYWGHRPGAIHPDHIDVVEVDLVALGHLNNGTGVARFARNSYARIACPIKVILDYFCAERRVRNAASLKLLLFLP